MKDLERLRKLMLANGLVRQKSGTANSMEIIPFGKNLFGLDADDDKKKKNDAIEGGCTSCDQRCQTGCYDGCAQECSTACAGGIF
jgi:hypothetical protein